MQRLQKLAAVAMMAGAMAPSGAHAMVSAFADFETSEVQFTDDAGNKLDSNFFSFFGATQTLDPRAVLRGVTNDPSSSAGFDKGSFDAGSGNLPEVREEAFVGDGTSYSDPGTDFSRGLAAGEGNIINRPGEDNANATATTRAEVQLQSEGNGAADSQVLLQVFNFVIAEGNGLATGDTVNLQLSFTGDLELVTDEGDPLFGTSPWSATSSYAVSAVDENDQPIDINQLDGDLADLNQSRALGGALAPTTTSHVIQVPFTVGVQQQISLDQQVRVRATAEQAPTEVPIPATLMLFGTGLLGLGVMTRRNARRRQMAA